jgi:hypothetical protein
MKLDSKYILKIFIMVFLIFALIVFVNYIGLNLNENNTSKKLLQVVTLEGLTNSELDTNIIMNKSDAFCESNRGSSGTLDDSCGKLTQDNCNTTSCCVWTSNNKCMAGNETGPTFNTDSNGKTKDLDYYYFQNKCYGAKCDV